jgi:hypothetical protein
MIEASHNRGAPIRAHAISRCQTLQLAEPCSSRSSQSRQGASPKGDILGSSTALSSSAPASRLFSAELCRGLFYSKKLAIWRWRDSFEFNFVNPPRGKNGLLWRRLRRQSCRKVTSTYVEDSLLRRETSRFTVGKTQSLREQSCRKGKAGGRIFRDYT